MRGMMASGRLDEWETWRVGDLASGRLGEWAKKSVLISVICGEWRVGEKICVYLRNLREIFSEQWSGFGDK